MATNNTKLKNLLKAEQEELTQIKKKLESLGSFELTAGRELGKEIKDNELYSDSKLLNDVKKKSMSVSIGLKSMLTAQKSATEGIKLIEEAFTKFK